MFETARPPVPRAALLVAALALGLAACSGPDSAPATLPAPADAPADVNADAVPAPVDAIAGDAEEPQLTCNADAVQSLVGQEASEAVVARATADSGSASVRVLGPGDAATMDFREDRLNILTDDAGVIEQLSCG